MSIVSEYNKRLSVFKSLKTRYNIDYNFKPPQTITRGSINRLDRAIEELKRIESVRKSKLEYEEFNNLPPRKDEDTAADMRWVLNFKVYYKNLINRVWFGKMVTPLVATAVENTIAGIDEIVNNAIEEHSYAWVRERLQNYGRGLRQKVQRLVLAVIDTGDGGYNTNENPWKQDTAGNAGRSRFNADIEELADTLEQQVPIYIIFS